MRTAGLGAVCALFAGLAAGQTSITRAMAARPAAEAAPATSAAEPPATLEAVLQAMFAAADVVFTGEVLSIERTAGAVTIRWQVEDAVRGTAAGEYVLREWDGLWADGARYTVGQRALVLLHAPSVPGYGSPMGGLDGVIPLRGDAAGSVLDLRWLAQHAAVSDPARLRPLQALRAAGGSLDVANALLARSAARPRSAVQALEPGGATAASSPDAVPTPLPSQQVDGAVVLGMLHAWQRAGQHVSGGVH